MKKPQAHTLRHLLHPQHSNNHRARILHPEWSVILAVLAVISVFTLSLSSKLYVQNGGYILGYATNITVDQVISGTNAERASSGLAPLTMSSDLSNAAMAKANDMFANQYWAHVSPTGRQPWDFIRESGYEYQAAGENLARDFYETNAMMQAWMESPTHKANIVNKRYSQIGVAVVNGTLNGTETTLVVQMFGAPFNVAPAPIVQAGDEVPRQVALERVLPTEIEQPQEPLQRITTTAQNADVTPVANQPASQVLAAFSFVTGTIRPWPSISPSQFVKALTVVLIAVVGGVLLYDWALLWVSPRSRLVGHNLAHILFLATIAVLVVTFQSGLIQ